LKIDGGKMRKAFLCGIILSICFPFIKIGFAKDELSMSISSAIVDLTGDRPKFREDMDLKDRDFDFSVDQFYLKKEWGEDFFAEMEANVRTLRHDNLWTLSLGKRGVFSIKGGFREIYKWYDNSEGFPTNFFPRIFEGQNDLFTNRRSFFLDGTITIPKFPRINLGYEHLTKKGDLMLLKGGRVGDILNFSFPTPKEVDWESNLFYLNLAHTLKGVNVGWKGLYQDFYKKEYLTESQFGLSSIQKNLTFVDRNTAYYLSSLIWANTYLAENLFLSASYDYGESKAHPESKRHMDSTAKDFLRETLREEIRKDRHAFNVGAVYMPSTYLTFRVNLLLEGKEEIGDDSEFEDVIENVFKLNRVRGNDGNIRLFTYIPSFELTYSGIPLTFVRIRLQLENSSKDWDQLYLLFRGTGMEGIRFKDTDYSEQKLEGEIKFRPSHKLSFMLGYRYLIKEWDEDLDVLKNDYYLLNDRDVISRGVSAEIKYRPSMILDMGIRYSYLNEEYAVEPLTGSETSLQMNKFTYFINLLPTQRLSIFSWVSTVDEEYDVGTKLSPDFRAFLPVELRILHPFDFNAFAPVEFKDFTTSYSFGASYLLAKKVTLSTDYYATVVRESTRNSQRRFSFRVDWNLWEGYDLGLSYQYYDFDEDVFNEDDFHGSLFLINLGIKF